jgi:L-threonylcarbamoyladenylate synthase
VERILISPDDPDPAAIARAADVIRQGGLVVFPTDTFYGLAADPRRADGVLRVFDAKGRDAARALPLVAADRAQVAAAASRLSALAGRLGDRFWPGPLTLVVDAAAAIRPELHGESGGVAIRIPDHAVARALAAAVGFAIISTSANRSGDPATIDAAQAAASLADRVDVVLDAGPTPGGRASTIVDARGETPVLVRAGAVPFESVQGDM